MYRPFAGDTRVAASVGSPKVFNGFHMRQKWDYAFVVQCSLSPLLGCESEVVESLMPFGSRRIREQNTNAALQEAFVLLDIEKHFPSLRVDVFEKM